MGLWVHTLQGLLIPRRAIAIAVVCVPMVALEHSFAGARGVLLALAIFGGFLLIGPVGYRALLPSAALADAGLGEKALRLLAFVLLAFAYVGAFGVVLPRLIGVRASILTDPFTLYSAGPLFWAGSWALGRDMEWEDRLSAAERRNRELSREAERAQLLALRAHLDPHFLFNTLNAIAEWCRDDPAVAERATLKLSHMLRTILGAVRAESWPLQQELELARDLLELHRARDPGRFSFALELGDGCDGARVPPLLLLPLVENAVKHGPAAGHRGAIELRCAARDGMLEIAVDNPGPYDGPREGGEGIPTLQQRLRLAYDGEASMDMRSDGQRTTASLRLPRQPSGGSA